MIDVLVIGSGGAGLSAAINAAKEKAKVVVVSKSKLSNNHTVMAQGGINAALGNVEPDSISKHIEDTLKAAHGLASPDMVKLLCESAKGAIEFLDSCGVVFSRLKEAKEKIKSIAQRRLGGASAKRACYGKDFTGLRIFHSLLDCAIKEGIDFLEDMLLLDLIVEEGKVKGAIFFDVKEGLIQELWAKTTILATGGFGGLYLNESTNIDLASGDGLVAVLQNGGAVSDLEFIQFHPTALKSSAILISESARGEGGYLVNSDGKRFVNELAPRDEVARAVYKELQEGREVFLDLRHLGKEKLLELMPQELELARLYEGVDASCELVPIKPVVHYSMGGIPVNEKMEAIGFENCFVVGEAANAKVHGANRLGGNSLLEIIAFGKIAGKNAAQKAKEIEFQNPNQSHIKKVQSELNNYFNKPIRINFYSARERLAKIFYEYVGIIRDEASLQKALTEIKKLQNQFEFMGIMDKSRKNNANVVDFYSFKNLLQLAPLVIHAALLRKESRGAHFRSDYPNEDAKFNYHILLKAREEKNADKN